MTTSDEVVTAIRNRRAELDDLLVVGLDGRSGVGKSTLAERVVAELSVGTEPVEAVIIDGDGFYAGGTAARWDRRTAEEKADQVIDWRRERAVLDGLRRWGEATWHPFDWDSDDWDQDPPPFADDPVSIEAAPVVILEGAYSCRPELHDLLDLRVLLVLPDDIRRRRLGRREGDESHADWDARWAEAEAHYFDTLMPPTRFDLVLPG